MISRDKEYYESGTLKTETPYKNGKKDGGQQSYYESGIMKVVRWSQMDFV